MSPIGFVTLSDGWVEDRLGRWRPPRWAELWMRASTRLGDGWAWAAVVVAAVARGEPPSRCLGEAVFAIVAVNVAQVALKHAFRRSRPRPLSPPTVAVPDRFSFPSGHTMNAFAVAALVTTHAPAAGPWAFGVAASVGASRIVLRVHYPSDVLAGACLGALIAALTACVPS